MRPTIYRRSTLGCANLLCITALASAAQSPGSNGWQQIGPGGGCATSHPMINRILLDQIILFRSTSSHMAAECGTDLPRALQTRPWLS